MEGTHAERITIDAPTLTKGGVRDALQDDVVSEWDSIPTRRRTVITAALNEQLRVEADDPDEWESFDVHVAEKSPGVTDWVRETGLVDLIDEHTDDAPGVAATIVQGAWHAAAMKGDSMATTPTTRTLKLAYEGQPPVDTELDRQLDRAVLQGSRTEEEMWDR